MYKHQKRRDRLILSAFIALSTFAIFQFGKIRVDGSTDAFIPKNHEISQINERIENEFGSMDSIILGIGINFGTVLEPDVLRLISDLTAVIESDPDVERAISLTNADYIESTPQGMSVVPLLEDFSAASVSLLKRRLVDWKDAYLGTIVSKNYKLGVIIVQPVAGSTNDALMRIYGRIRALTPKYESANISFQVAGLPVVKGEINESVTTDIAFLIPIAAVLILGVMFISFRRLEGVLYPLVSLLIAGVWIVGVLGLFGITFTMASMLVPVLLLVVGSAYGIHVMSHFYEEVSHRTGRLDYQQVCDIIRSGIGRIRLSVILAGATTAGGFISQLSSPLSPFRAFGVLSALGVIFAQITSLILIPLMLRLRYRKGIDTEAFHNHKSVEDRTKTRRVFVMLEKLVRRGKWPITALSLLLVAATIIAIPGIKVGTNMIDFFRRDSTVARDTEVFNSQLSGTGLVSVLIEAPEKGAIFEPSFLHQLELFDAYIRDNHEHVMNVQSLVPNIIRINKVMNRDRVPYEALEIESETLDFFGSDDLFAGNEGDPDDVFQDDGPASASMENQAYLTYDETAELLQQAVLNAGDDCTAAELVDSFLSGRNYQGASFDELPVDPAKYGLATEEDLKNLISQYMVLYSGNLSHVINDDLEPNSTLITLQLNREDGEVLNPLRDGIAGFWDYHLPDGWSYSIGGGTTIALVLSELVTKSQYYSLIGALVIVWLIVTIMFRSPIAGLLGLIPVAFALMGIFSLMALLNFSLDIVTSLLASLAIGIGVDYAIHYMNAYKRCITDGDPNPLATVYRTTGAAIFYNALSVAVGFLGLLISRFIPIQQLGILFSVSMICACLASLIVLPMVLEIAKPRFLRNQKTQSRSVQ
jgi:uncharacterized protein